MKFYREIRDEHTMFKSKVPFMVYFVQYIHASVVRRINTLLCNWRGHNYVDYSHITPDEGVEEFECTRCGQGNRVIFY